MKTFPMFLRMQDRHVVIVGGGEQAGQLDLLLDNVRCCAPKRG